MTLVLICFAVAAVAAAATIAVNAGNRRAGRRTIPAWLLAVNLVATVVTLVLAILVEVNGP